MRQELEFGGGRSRGGDLSWCASSSVSLAPWSPRSAQHAQRNAFLIDTPAIRNVVNSCGCIVECHANRHSSGGRALHHNRALGSKLKQSQNGKESLRDTNSTNAANLIPHGTLESQSAAGLRKTTDNGQQQERSRSLTDIRGVRGWVRDDNLK
jgi:hypothetical protein